MIAAIALIVVGPKDLPILMRKVGKAMGRMRAMAAEFRASFDEMARQSELEELPVDDDGPVDPLASEDPFEPDDPDEDSLLCLPRESVR